MADPKEVKQNPQEKELQEKDLDKAAGGAGGFNQAGGNR